MPETITFYAASVEDITACGEHDMSITLADVDLGRLVLEIDPIELLEQVPTDVIKQYLYDKENPEEEDAE